jgi:hypothetical protein
MVGFSYFAALSNATRNIFWKMLSGEPWGKFLAMGS